MSAGDDATVDQEGAALDELRGATDRLVHEFAGTFSRQTVQACLHDSHARLGPARVQTYQPLFAYRFARERLRARAVASGAAPRRAPEVLFVCTRNAGRSQLAAALLEHRAAGRVVVRSAGTEPAGALHPHIADTLAEAGVDASAAFPKPITDEVVQAADVVVTMGCGDACPVLPGRRYVDWDLPDPEGKTAEQVRAVRDDVTRRVDLLLAELLGPGA
jgi:protein-tyrosine-phosphatase